MNWFDSLCRWLWRLPHPDEVLRARFYQERLERETPGDLVSYRHKFRRNLVGLWLSDSGSGPFALTRWCFLANGTAQQLHMTSFGDEEMWFLWREAEDFSIELLESPEEEEDSAPEWSILRYDFKIVGERIVLFQSPANENFKFYDRLGFLVFAGDTEPRDEE